MRLSTIVPLVVSAVLMSPGASADIRFRFVEGAPKDTFVIMNSGTCPMVDTSVQIDLSSAVGKLIFDVTDQGEGVNVFQPFEVVEGMRSLKKIPSVRDGQSTVRLEIGNLEPGAVIAFTIDVDDTIGQQETMISDSEIQGAMVSVVQSDRMLTAEFTGESEALLAIPGCRNS